MIKQFIYELSNHRRRYIWRFTRYLWISKNHDRRNEREKDDFEIGI